jgi:hypothetical protein
MHACRQRACVEASDMLSCGANRNKKNGKAISMHSDCNLVSHSRVWMGGAYIPRGFVDG